MNIGMLRHYLVAYRDEILEYILDEEYPANKTEAESVCDEFKQSLARLRAIDTSTVSYLVNYLKANIGDIADSLTDDCPSIESIQETLDMLSAGSDEVKLSRQPLETPPCPAPAFVVGARVQALRGDWKLGTIVGVDENSPRFQVRWDDIHLSDGSLWKKGKKTWYQKKALQLVEAIRIANTVAAQEKSKP